MSKSTCSASCEIITKTYKPHTKITEQNKQQPANIFSSHMILFTFCQCVRFGKQVGKVGEVVGGVAVEGFLATVEQKHYY